MCEETNQRLDNILTRLEKLDERVEALELTQGEDQTPGDDYWDNDPYGDKDTIMGLIDNEEVDYDALTNDV